MAQKIKKSKSTLTLSKAEKSVEMYDHTHLFEFSDGETLIIYPRFRPSLTEEMLEEYGHLLKSINENVGSPLRDKDQIYLLHFLIVKYFTDLKDSFSNDWEVILSQFNTFVDSIYFKELMEVAFLREEIQKVWDKANEIVSTLTLMSKLDEKFREKMNTLEVQNQDLINI